MGHESKCGWAGCLWLKVFHEVPVKLWAGALVSSADSLGDGGGVFFQAYSRGCWQTLPLHGAASCHVSWFPLGEPSKAEKRLLPECKPQSCYNLILGGTLLHFSTFHSLAMSQQTQPTLRGGSHKVWILRDGAQWGHPGGSLPHYASSWEFKTLSLLFSFIQLSRNQK